MAIKEVCWIPKNEEGWNYWRKWLSFLFLLLRLKSFPFEQSNGNKWDELNVWKCIIVAGLSLIFIHILNIFAQNYLHEYWIHFDQGSLLARSHFETDFLRLFWGLLLLLFIYKLIQSYPIYSKHVQIFWTLSNWPKLYFVVHNILRKISHSKKS